MPLVLDNTALHIRKLVSLPPLCAGVCSVWKYDQFLGTSNSKNLTKIFNLFIIVSVCTKMLTLLLNQD